MRGDIREREEPLFACIIEPEGELVHVRVMGELDLATAPVLETALADLREAGFAQVILDLRQLTFIACAGIHILLTQDAALLACGGRLRIVVAPGFVDQVFDLAGVRGRLSLERGTAGSRSPAGDAAERSYTHERPRTL